MKKLVLSSALAMVVLTAPALAQDDAIPYDGAIEYGTIEYGAVEYGTVEYGTVEYGEGLLPDTAETYDVPLAPGEEIIGVYAAPSVIQAPAEPEILFRTAPYVPPVDIDRVTGLPRNTAGWTGDTQRPAAIACFPDACADLNL